MLNKISKSSEICATTHYQLSTVKYKTHNYYEHHHYYHNDLFYRRDIKAKKYKRSQKRNRIKESKSIKCSINKKSNHKKYLSSKNVIQIYSSSISNINNDQTNGTTDIRVCYCANSDKECCKLYLKSNYVYQINNFLRHISIYVQKYFNDLKLVMVLILLSALTITAHKIENTREKLQQKSILAAFNVVYPHNQHNKMETNLSFQITKIYQHVLKNLDENSTAKRIKLKNYCYYEKDYKKLFRYHYHHNNADADHHHYYHHEQSDSTLINNKTQQSKNSRNKQKPNEINIENEIPKLLKQHPVPRKVNNTKIYHNKNEIFTNLTTNSTNTFNETRTVKMYANDIIDSDFNDFIQDNGDDIHMNKYENKIFRTAPSSAPAALITASKANSQHLHFVHNGQQQIDYIKLMKLVMDGLGLKKLPNMATVNVSQDEYISKYREYLQRVHTRKCLEVRQVFDECDEKFLRPLKIVSITSNSTLLVNLKEHRTYKDINVRRQKRNIILLNDDDENNDDTLTEQSLQDRVRNILFLKKKYQKSRSTKKDKDERKTNIRLMFALKPEILNLSSSDIEEANIRLVLIHSPILALRNSKNKKGHTKSKINSCGSNKNDSHKNYNHDLNLKLFAIPRTGRRILLDGRKIGIHVDPTKIDETHTQWLQFDVSKAVKLAIEDKHVVRHVVLELQCDNCKRIGARILNDGYNTAVDALDDDPFFEGHHLMPVLNIIGHIDQNQSSIRPHKYNSDANDTNGEPTVRATTERHYHHQTYNNNNKRNNRRTNCYKANQRCCRHSMEVTFKEIKGFEFIIQPKVFDAGYCHGRCPPRYNPAHHHALLQSLIWKQHHNTPRPCCAPSKLVELEVLHVDEKNSDKLKISTWSDMRVVECACS